MEFLIIIVVLTTFAAFLAWTAFFLAQRDFQRAMDEKDKDIDILVDMVNKYMKSTIESQEKMLEVNYEGKENELSSTEY